MGLPMILTLAQILVFTTSRQTITLSPYFNLSLKLSHTNLLMHTLNTHTTTFAYLLTRPGDSPYWLEKPTWLCRRLRSQDWPTSAWFGLVWERSDYSLSWNRTEVDLPPTSPSSALPSMTAMLRMCVSLCLYCVSAHIAVSHELRGAGFDESKLTQ